MKVLRKQLWVFFVMLFIVGCQKTEKQYHIGVSQCSDDAWRNKLNTEMRIGGYYYTNLDISIASAQDNDDLQIQQIDTLSMLE